MDIHRCRFVPFPPQAINALAFSRPSDTQKQCPRDQRLAIGRANGDIEIWNPAGGLWSQETTFRGGKDRSIEGLAWTQDLEDDGDEHVERKEVGKLRLFSIGFSSAVTEWDLALGVPARHANGNSGAIWCLAAQPRWESSSAQDDDQNDSSGRARHDQYLAAGCEDGAIVLFSTEDGDLHYLRTIAKAPTKKPRILSITWKDRNTIIAGCSDSHIRVYDIRNRQTIRNMSLGKSAIGGNETLVWAVKCLPDGTIISGDSAGDLKIWDGNNYSLVQRLHCHEADILDITTNASGSMVISGGADRRTVVYKSIPAEKGNQNRRWAQIMHRRFHEHDVKTLVSFESQDLSLVVSGGLDTTPVVMPLRGWQKEYHRTLSHLPQSPQVCSAPQSRLFISWWDHQINIWHLSRQAQSHSSSDSPTMNSENHTLLTQIFLKGEENITSARISNDSKYLAVATVSNVRVFSLRLKRNPLDGRISIRTKKLETLPSLDIFGARLVLFSPDSCWLCSLRANNEIVLVRIEKGSDIKALARLNKHVVKLNRSFSKITLNPETAGLGEYMDTISTISFSTNSRLLAVGDLSGRIYTWVLEGVEHSTNGLVHGATNRRGSDSSTSSVPSSSDEDSSNDEDDSAFIHGQRWRKNRVVANLPALDDALLILSFRPGIAEQGEIPSTAHVRSHPTRKTPYPHSHDMPDGEDRLIAVTAQHKVVEFHVLQGMLTAWSRRNPASYMPQQFQRIRERAMGCFWDISANDQRLWLYGSTWMFMLDLAQDLPLEKTVNGTGPKDLRQPPQSSKQNKKRKREELDAEKLRDRGSGAGGTVSLSESYVGVGCDLRKFKSSEERSQVIRLDQTPYPASDNDEDSTLGTSSHLAQVRRRAQGIDDEESLANGDVTLQVNGVASHSQEDSHPIKPAVKKCTKSASFLTLKYRSILGIVPIGGGSDEEDGLVEGSEPTNKKNAPQIGLEVAIIERPLWDVDMPPRFDGGQDWET